MKCKIIILFCVTLSFGAVAQKKTNSVPRPKLVVGLMVDQMRWDYLFRYYSRYQSNGFKRLLSEGFSCDNTMIDYVPTVTAIGHASVYTGSVPAIHGIAGNDFIIQATGKKMYCTQDDSAQTIGSTSTAGKMSPRNLQATTITDELKLATNFQSKVIGIALKDRGAILAAGHVGDAAYWFDDLSGNWISSDWYLKELPAWVNAFNAKKLPEHYLKTDWNTLYPIDTYRQSTPDQTPYERAFRGSSGPTLPVKTSELYKESGLGIIRQTPSGNTLSFDFAKEAIRHEKLGQGTSTDFLALSLSSPDYIGHMYGPNAVEVEDMYLRLDQQLAEFLQYLDKTVGKGAYTLFLTSDHGAAHNPRFMIDHKLPAGYWPGGVVLKQLNALLEAKYQAKGLVIDFTNYQINLNQPVIQANNLPEEEINKQCLRFLEKRAGVAFVVNNWANVAAHVPEMLRKRIANGYNVERSGAVQFILKPGWYSASHNAGGTTHGSWNPYDAHIPLIWMGWGIKKGKSNAPISITDISATLAALLQIQMPSGCIGQPITHALK